MNPGQESVDEYFAAHYPPCREELDALKADLRAKAGKLPRRYRKEHGKWLITVDVADLTALFDGIGDE